MAMVLARASLCTIALLFTAAAVSLGDGVPVAVHYFDHDKIAAMWVKGGNLVNDPGFVVAAGRRGVGQAEYHDHTSHVFIVVEGEVTLVTGGTMVDAKRTASDQMRGTSIEGGETFHLTKGDVITVPAKTPHWFKEIPTNTIAYYAINIESQ
jgi:mannose-6-phosphate isomerase-like protein (cupin superfamily)